MSFQSTVTGVVGQVGRSVVNLVMAAPSHVSDNVTIQLQDMAEKSARESTMRRRSATSRSVLVCNIYMVYIPAINPHVPEYSPYDTYVTLFSGMSITRCMKIAKEDTPLYWCKCLRIAYCGKPLKKK